MIIGIVLWAMLRPMTPSPEGVDRASPSTLDGRGSHGTGPVTRPPRESGGGLERAARIYGAVSSAQDRRPLGYARVTLSGRERREAWTDKNGNYRFEHLAFGRYVLIVHRAGFADLESGQSAPFEPGRSILVRQEDPAYKADFNLPAGAILTGRIVDPAGDPISDAIIKILRYEYDTGELVLRTVKTGADVWRSDEEGHFRIVGIPPGSYLVSAVMNGGSGGRILTQAPYSETYFPGTPYLERAGLIDLASGRTTTISLALRLSKRTTIRGQLFDSAGARVTDRAALIRITKLSGSVVIGTTEVANDGSFSLDIEGSSSPCTITALVSRGKAFGGDGIAEFGTASTTPGDATNIAITVRPGGVVSGRVIANGVAELPAALESMRIFARPIRRDGTVAGSISVRPDHEGRFVLKNVFEPSYIVADLDPISGWQTTDVLLDSKVVTDTGVTPDPTKAIEGIRVVVTNRINGVQGEVIDSDGRLVSDSVVLIWASNPLKWRNPSDLRVHVVKPDASGHYSIVGLRDGLYFMSAMRTFDMGHQTDESYLQGLVPGAERLQVNSADGDTIRLDLRLKNR
jgi:protocatechuate 3,4-dioxygenase beta subunit